MSEAKEAEVRKSEILDAAQRLFATKGYDGTSTTDILREVGIARGTLYYHFRSKEEILDAVIARTTGQLVERASALVTDESMPVLERFTKTLLSLHVSDASSCALLEKAHEPQNALMHLKMQEQLLAQIGPVLTWLIEEAISQGICQTDYPAQVTEMTLLYASVAFDTLAQCTSEERQQKVLGFIYNLERLLNMPSGSLQETVLPAFET